MGVLTIESVGVRGLHVTLASANELSFVVDIGDGADYDKTITDICRVVPLMLRYDASLSEAHDDAFHTQPRPLDLEGIRLFTRTDQARLSNGPIDFGGFPQG